MSRKPSTFAVRQRQPMELELARYQSDVGTRRVVGQRVDGVVQLRDEPLGHDGRAFLIEPAVDRKAEMDAIVADYLRQAKRLGFVPMVSLGW